MGHVAQHVKLAWQAHIHLGVLVQVPATWLPIQLLANPPQRQLNMAKELGSPATDLGNRVEFLAPAFSLAQPWME